MRTLAIGDIHGCLRAFDSLLDMVSPDRDDLVIALGDYVDRGPNSKGVLDRLIDLQGRCRLVALKGNHDLMMLAACDDTPHFDEWLSCGGKETLISYGADADKDKLAAAVPARHWQFLRDDCVAYFETAEHIFVHASLYPDLPLDEQPEYMLFWETLDAHSCHESGKTMICGHSVQRSGKPLVLEHAICIDTWVYGDGWLTCLDVEKEAYWQANQRGETRMGMLRFRQR